MFQEKFSEQKREMSEGNIEISEQKIAHEIQENSQGFLNWFENLKNSIGEWPKKFFKNKAIKNAIIYASIPFAILSATKQEVKAEDIVSEFVNRPAISQEAESEEIANYEIKADDLISVADSQQKEILAKRINKELFAFDKFSDAFNQALLENKDSIPKENLERLAVKDGQVFDFAGRMKFKINKANQFFEEISSTKDDEVKKYKIEEHNKNLFQNGLEIFKILPQAFFSQQLSLLVHELGHKEKALEWGATDVKIDVGFLGGSTSFNDKNLRKESKKSITAAGINASKQYGEFLVNNLREHVVAIG